MVQFMRLRRSEFILQVKTFKDLKTIFEKFKDFRKSYYLNSELIKI